MNDYSHGQHVDAADAAACIDNLRHRKGNEAMAGRMDESYYDEKKILALEGIEMATASIKAMPIKSQVGMTPASTQT